MCAPSSATGIFRPPRSSRRIRGLGFLTGGRWNSGGTAWRRACPGPSRAWGCSSSSPSRWAGLCWSGSSATSGMASSSPMRTASPISDLRPLGTSGDRHQAIDCYWNLLELTGKWYGVALPLSQYVASWVVVSARGRRPAGRGYDDGHGGAGAGAGPDAERVRLLSQAVLPGMGRPALGTEQRHGRRDRQHRRVDAGGGAAPLPDEGSVKAARSVELSSERLGII